MYGIPSLAYHEGIPGHHLQVAINNERDAPLFRRLIAYTAFDEGWALYAERLVSELGWYDDDPAGDVGRLQWEALRAARLVVDTGIHVDGWTRAEAITYLDENVAFDPGLLSSAGQADRYAALPGQATAYQIGMRSILRMRAEAQRQLGASFDVIAFHRELLGGGSLPLPVAQRRMRDWVARQN